MKRFINTYIAIILISLSISACSSDPKPGGSTYNSPESQKANARKAQRELSSETAK